MLTTRGKTEYHFTVHNVQDAEQKIQSWLSANSFRQMQENGEIFYRSDSAMLGRRFLEYTINGPTMTIYAYLGSRKKPMALAEGIAGSMGIIPYKNALDPLFAALSSAPANPVNPVNTQTQQVAQQLNQQPQPQPQNTYNEFRQAAAKRNDTCAEISFWVSILMILVSFTGVIVGAILVVFNYYLAAQGLKSNKKGKATAAIILSSVAIAIMIIKLII